MRLEVKRWKFGAAATIGRLYVDGEFECYTLEDVVREKSGVPVEQWKVDGETAIPCGTYPVTVSYSNRFQKDLPLVSNVQGFAGIRIHSGNTAADTEGCILVGKALVNENFIGQSRMAFDELFEKIKSAKEVSLQVS